MTDPTLDFIQRQLERVLFEIGDMRDTRTIDHAILTRLENTAARTEAAIDSLRSDLRSNAAELRAVQSRLDRLVHQLRPLLDEKQPG